MAIAAPPQRIEDVEEREFGLFGFQAGPLGFVQRGCGEPGELTQWEDYLYQRVAAGVGAGKSAGGGIRTINYMVSWPGCHGLVVVPVRDTWVDSTFPAFQKMLAMFDLKEGRDWEFNKTEHHFVLFVEDKVSEFWVKSTEEEESKPKIVGVDAAFIWADEPGQMPYVAFQHMQQRLRQPGFPHQWWGTGTPTGRRHWCVGIFRPDTLSDEDLIGLKIDPRYLGGDGDVRREVTLDDNQGRERTITAHYVSYKARTRDNPFGGLEHHAQLVATYGENSLLARQELYGEDVLMEGLVFGEVWNPEFHVKPEEKWPTKRPQRVCAGIDFGWSNPAAIIVEGMDGLNRRYLMDEFYGRHVPDTVLAEKALELQRKYGIEHFFADPEDPQGIATLRALGVPIRKFKKSLGRPSVIGSGIGLCHRALNSRIGKDATQGFFVSPKCRHFIAEMEGYILDPGKEGKNDPERPRTKDDHLMSAWRYAETGIVKPLRWDVLPRFTGGLIETRYGE